MNSTAQKLVDLRTTHYQHVSTFGTGLNWLKPAIKDNGPLLKKPPFSPAIIYVATELFFFSVGGEGAVNTLCGIHWATVMAGGKAPFSDMEISAGPKSGLRQGSVGVGRIWSSSGPETKAKQPILLDPARWASFLLVGFNWKHIITNTVPLFVFQRL